MILLHTLELLETVERCKQKRAVGINTTVCRRREALMKEKPVEGGTRYLIPSNHGLISLRWPALTLPESEEVGDNASHMSWHPGSARRLVHTVCRQHIDTAWNELGQRSRQSTRREVGVVIEVTSRSRSTAHVQSS